MAFVPMDENQIQFLANEIARTYMVNKTQLSDESFVEEYLMVYEVAKKIIAQREQKKQSDAEKNEPTAEELISHLTR